MVLVPTERSAEGWEEVERPQVSQVSQAATLWHQEQGHPRGGGVAGVAGERPQGQPRQEPPAADKAQDAGLLHAPDGQAATWPQQSTQIISRSNPAAVRWTVDQVNRLLLAALREKRPAPSMPEFNPRADPATDLSWMMLGADARACNWDPQQHFSMAFPAPASA